MKSRPRFIATFLRLGAVLLCSLGCAPGQVLGLYKEGKLLEPLGSVSVPDPAPAAPGPATEPVTGSKLRITDPAPLRTLASRQSAQLQEEIRLHLHRIHSRSGSATAAELSQLADLRTRLTAAAAQVSDSLHELSADLAERGFAPEIQRRHAAAMDRMRQNKAAYLAALEAVLESRPGAIAEALRLAEAYRPHRPDAAPEEPGHRAHQLEAPRLTRAEADALLAASPSKPEAGKEGGLPPPPEQAPRKGAPTPADLAETVEIQFTPEITAQAAALGNAPLAIYEFVRNKVQFQPYLGSRKGAGQTLAQHAGNDADQASLLIALLRASGIPARYVRGTVELTPAQAAGWLGVDDPAVAGNILTTAGMDGLNIFSGPDVSAVRCTRVWVEAYVPYSHYRGLPFDGTGRTWIPMDPAFYRTILTPGEDVLTPMGFDPDAFLSSHISSLQPESPVARLRSEVQSWLTANRPGQTVDQIMRRTAIDPEELGLLPAGLATRVLNVSARFPELEEHQRYKVRFHLYDGATPLIDHTLYVSQLAGQELTIDYVGATPADQSVIDSFYGIYNTPPNLVNVKPVLKLNGAPVATSTNSLGMGLVHKSDMHFLQPLGASNVQPVVENDITAGNGQAIGFNTFLDLPAGGLFGSASSSFLGDILASTASDYLRRVDDGMRTAGAIMRVASTQDLSEAIVESSVAVNYNFGTPITFEWNGLIVDADRRIVGSFPVDGDVSKKIPFMKLTGYEGSNQENLVFEETFNQDAVSTIKILQLASDRGIDLCTITTSIATDCPDLNQSATVVNAITNALAQGRHVIVPKEPLTVGLWSGTGYINVDPATGAAGYIISGGISGESQSAGGATVDSWPINLGCSPIGPVTGTITPNGFSAGAVLCGDNNTISYTVTLMYQCRDSEGNIINQTFGPTSHTVPKTRKAIATTYGSGTYTISLPGTAVTPVSFTLVYLEFAEASKTVCWTQGGTFDAKGALTPTSAQDNGLVSWSITGNPSATVSSSGQVTFAGDGGDYMVKVAANGNAACSATLNLKVVKVVITPASMAVVESLDSGTFTCTVTPAGSSPTYEWLQGADKGAWPAGAGNDPELDYSSPSAMTTTVKKTRWFAQPDDRHWLVTGDRCTYTINCEVTVDGVKCRAQMPAAMTVSVDATGTTTWPQFADTGTIQISSRMVGGNTEWYVSGKGSFHRTAPVKTNNLPATSQFYAKVDAHEAKHVTQWTAEAPWKDLFDADALYTSTLSNLTSQTSEADLRNKINQAVATRNTADVQTANDTKCAREIAAFQVDRAIAPHYQELDDAEVPGVYNCTP